MTVHESRNLALLSAIVVVTGCATRSSDDTGDMGYPRRDTATLSSEDAGGGGDTDSRTEASETGDIDSVPQCDPNPPTPTGLSTDGASPSGSDFPSDTARECPTDTGADTKQDTETDTPGRPNLIIVYTDDQQFDGMGANGNHAILTPRLDTLASQGIRFTQASVVTSLCSPSRAALLTGRFNRANGVEQLGGDLEPGEVTLAERLQAEGYRTAMTGKWHIADIPEDLGFEFIVQFWANGRYYGREVHDLGDTVVPGEHVDAYCTDRAIDFITEASAQEGPFFLFHNTQAPHWDNHTWPVLADTLSLYDPDLMPLPGSWDDDLSGKPPYLEGTRNIELGVENGYDDPAAIREETRHYYAAITKLDDILGRLFDAIDGLDLRNNTYIVVMSDNGWLLADHGMAGKVMAYEPSIRVPMFVLGPDIQPGTTDALVQNIDVAPTLLDMAGIPIPETMHGRSLLPLLRGETTEFREIAVYETLVGFGGTHPMLGAFDSRYKVIQTRSPDDMAVLEFAELYDVTMDPFEMTNLWNDPAVTDAQARLNGAIDAHVETILGW